MWLRTITGAFRSPSLLLFLHLAFTAIITTVRADCECGYTLPTATGTSSSPRWPFTEILESDFLHTHALAPDVWRPQAYNVSPGAANGPFGKAAQVRNVALRPIKDEWDWGVTAEDGGDPGLQLWVRTALLPVDNGDDDDDGGGDGGSGGGDDPTGEGMVVPMSEIVSVRGDVLYGSFRIGMKTSAVNGTCGAFFFYLDDSTEIDMEFLSRQQSQQRAAPTDSDTGTDGEGGLVNLVIQSPESQALGYVQPGTPDFKSQGLAFEPTEGYHDYRFDWAPGRVEFFADGRLLAAIEENVPSAAGYIHLSHWSNGNLGWSGGPPQQDAVLTVSYVKAYFNSSDAHTTAKSLQGCTPGGKVCEIPDQLVPPDPTGPDGNQTGHTFFFTNTSSSIEAQNGSSPTLQNSALRLGGLLCTRSNVVISLVVAGLIH